MLLRIEERMPDSADNMLRIGTRGSRLALVQTEMAARALREIRPDLQIRVERIRTEGDRRRDVPLAAFGGRGVFTRTIEQALLDGRIDVAVHSCKDLPTGLPSGLALGAVLPRGPLEDALVVRAGWEPDPARLPRGACVGAGSARRRAALLALRRDLRVVEVRGNLDTRLRKLTEGRVDALVAAAAGLERLGAIFEGVSWRRLDPVLFPPAAGQGAIVCEFRTNDARTAELLRKIDHEPTHLAIACERQVLAGLEAGCRTPLGVTARVQGDVLTLFAVLFSEDGTRRFEARCNGKTDQYRDLVAAVVQELREAACRGRGAGED